MTSSLRQRALSGVLWNFSEQIMRRGIGFFVTLLLARLLAPEDFGTLAVILGILMIAESLTDSGVKQALIRKHPAHERDFSTVFLFNISLSLVSYALIFTAAPALADFFDDPRFAQLLRWTALIIPIQSLQTVPVVVLSRKLRFHLQLRATVPGTLLSGVVAIALAVNGFGIWALVAQLLTMAVSTTTIILAMRLWRPHLHFSRKSLSEMLGFGTYLFLATLIDKSFRQVYVIIIARSFSTSLAGYYFMAEKIKDFLMTQMVTAIQTVTYPALAQLQEDQARLKEAYRRLIMTTTYCLFPVMTLSAALAHPLFAVLLPAQWQQSADYLQLMCLAAMLYPLQALNINVLSVRGRSDLILALAVVKKAVFIAILFISVHYGIRGILLGHILGSVISYLLNAGVAGRLIKYSTREQARDFGPALAAALVCGALTYACVQVLANLPAIATLLIAGIIGSGLYLLFTVVPRLEAYSLTRGLLLHRLWKPDH